MSALALEAPEKNTATSEPPTELAPVRKVAERPFQASILFVTMTKATADNFLRYLGKHYRGHARLDSIPNYGDAVSHVTAFHYALPHATIPFIEGLYRLVNGTDTFLYIYYEGLPAPIMCAGR